jgi:hypothetical protein
MKWRRQGLQGNAGILIIAATGGLTGADATSADEAAEVVISADEAAVPTGIEAEDRQEIQGIKIFKRKTV